MLARACAASGQEQAAARHYAVESIRYRPGRRHVLRYKPLNAPGHEPLFAKVYADADGERAFRVAMEVAGWLGEHGGGASSVRPLAYVAEDGVVLYRRIVGESLCGHLQKKGRGVGGSLAAVGAALSALHELPVSRVGTLKAHDFAAEVKKIGRSSGHIPALLPTMGTAIEGLLERAGELHERFPQEGSTFTHGDCISEHVWVSEEGITLIDLDNCRLADPALDIGKFLADLRFWHAVYNRDGVEEAQEQFLAGYGRGVPPERLVRARLYEAIELVKAAVRRVYMFERNWASRTGRLIGQAQALMNDLHNEGSAADLIGPPPERFSAPRGITA
jgi:Phosphotransferase enzyme family